MTLENADMRALDERLGRIESLLAAARSVRSPRRGPRRCKLSIVSPCYNEKENLASLHERTSQACRTAGIDDYEIIWVENGSRDGSLEAMRAIAEKDKRLKVVQLSRNFGYQGAITCALSHAGGDHVAVLDGDLQDPPELIPDMLRQAQAEGFDVVYGVKEKRKEGLLKRFFYAAFYRFWKFTSEIDVPVDAGEFCVMARRVVDAINSLPERQRFIRGLRAWSGFKQTGFKYKRDARNEGESKFNLGGMVSLALDGIIAYSVLPLRMTAFLGFFISFISVSLAVIQGAGRIVAYRLGSDFFGVLPSGLTQTNLVIACLFGMQMISVGVVGEYVGRIYGEVKDRPPYLVSGYINFAD